MLRSEDKIWIKNMWECKKKLPEYCWKNFSTRKCGNCECIATWGRPTSRSRLFFGQFCTAHAQTAISQPPIKILTSESDSSTTIY